MSNEKDSKEIQDEQAEGHKTEGQPTAAEMAETMVLPDDADSGVVPEEYAETQVLPDEDIDPALTEALEKADENWNLYVRAKAEADNVRRRSEREVENAHRFGVEKFAKEMLSVLDSLELGIQAADSATVETLLEGNQAALKQFLGALEKFGIEILDPEGEPFNPEFHEAMVMQPSETAEPNSVLQVVQTGYVLNGRVLRPARVIVAKEP